MIFVRLIAVAGLLLILEGVWIPSKAVLAQILIERAWEARKAGDPTPRPWPWADTYPVARIHIPTQSKTYYALRGASGESMAFGPAHVSASAAPGEADNIVFAGHRDTHFAVLEDLELGQLIEVESVERIDTYRVTGFDVVHESRIDLLARSGVPELTLITCYPFDAIVPGGPLRYVVHATQVEAAGSGGSENFAVRNTREIRPR
jgi:sortase A